jgi:hypothetical protein
LRLIRTIHGSCQRTIALARNKLIAAKPIFQPSFSGRLNSIQVFANHMDASLVDCLGGIIFVLQAACDRVGAD